MTAPGQAKVLIHGGEINVIMRRMDVLQAAIGDRFQAPHQQQSRIEYAYDQVLRALTKTFELRGAKVSDERPNWKVAPAEGPQAGVLRTVCNAIWNSGLYIEQDTVELFADSIVEALRGIIPDQFYSDGATA